MTLDDLKRIDREFLTPAQVAEILNCSAHGVRIWARQRPEQLGFPVCVIGHRTKIPRRAFVAWMEGKKVGTA
jgi:hypothetical protein